MNKNIEFEMYLSFLKKLEPICFKINKDVGT